MHRIVITGLAVVSPVEISKTIFSRPYFIVSQGRRISLVLYAATSLDSIILEPQVVCEASSLFSRYEKPSTLTVDSHYGIQVEYTALLTRCIGSIDAISYAHENMTYGDRDVILTGTSEAPIPPITIAAFDLINCFSHHTKPTKDISSILQDHSGL